MSSDFLYFSSKASTLISPVLSFEIYDLNSSHCRVDIGDFGEEVIEVLLVVVVHLNFTIFANILSELIER